MGCAEDGFWKISFWDNYWWFDITKGFVEGSCQDIDTAFYAIFGWKDTLEDTVTKSYKIDFDEQITYEAIIIDESY
jgi:hypothetical protein